MRQVDVALEKVAEFSGEGDVALFLQGSSCRAGALHVCVAAFVKLASPVPLDEVMDWFLLDGISTASWKHHVMGDLLGKYPYWSRRQSGLRSTLERFTNKVACVEVNEVGPLDHSTAGVAQVFQDIDCFAHGLPLVYSGYDALQGYELVTGTE